MNNNQRRVLFILVIVSLGVGLVLMVINPTQSVPEPQIPETVKADFAAELKRTTKSTTSSFPPIKVQWRLVIAKGKLKGKTPPVLDCPTLDDTGKSFLTELAKRYPDIEFSSPASGENILFNNGYWYPYPQVKYQYAHPELGNLHVGFPVAVKFTPEKSTDRVLVADNHQKNFNLAYDEINSTPNPEDVMQFIQVTPLFVPKSPSKKDGVPYVTLGQTVLFKSYSCYFQQRDKKFQPVDTHMLFYRVLKPEAP